MDQNKFCLCSADKHPLYHNHLHLFDIRAKGCQGTLVNCRLVRGMLNRFTQVNSNTLIFSDLNPEKHPRPGVYSIDIRNGSCRRVSESVIEEFTLLSEGRIAWLRAYPNPLSSYN